MKYKKIANTSEGPAVQTGALLVKT